MKNKLAVFAFIFSLFAMGTSLFPKQGGHEATSSRKESTYDRIVRTNMVRCAYSIWPPYLNRDMNTGKISGVYYDLMERMVKDWGMKLEWTEEVGAVNRFEGLNAGRYDLLCSPVAGTPERTAAGDFSRPFVYNPFYLYVRAGDTRFDNAYDKANDESISMLSIDGYVGIGITKAEFPKAKLSTLPNLTTDIDVLVSIEMGKADAAVCDSNLAQDYIKANPGKIKQASGPPVRIFGEALSFPIGEERLKAKINTSLSYYLDTGVIEKILEANGMEKGRGLRVATPYVLPNE